MARPIANGLELSWHRPTGQWYRSVPVDLDEQGRVRKARRYFGKGKSNLDRPAYRAALAKYQAYLDDWDLRTRVAQVHQRLQRREPGPTALEQALARQQPWHYDPQLSEDQIEAREAQHRLHRRMHREALGRQHQDAPAPGGPTIAELADRWLEQERARQQAGQISPVGYTSKANGIATFTRWCGASRRFGEPVAIERLLGDYRGMLLERFRAGDYTANTVNDKTKFLKQFIDWAYQHRHLDEPPRTLPTVVRKLPTPKAGRPLSLAQVRSIWAQANPRMKCWIALGLNCGFKNQDLVELRAADLRGDRLVAQRSKTKAPMNYKLWPVTLKLLAATRQDQQNAEGRIFCARSGGPLTSQTVCALFKKVAVRAEAVVGTNRVGAPAFATFEQLRDTSAERVRGSLLARGRDLSVLQLFLAHKDRSTAAFYTSNDPASLRSEPLDQELAKLERDYRLTFETD